jgi:hypothetical protein
MMQIPFLFLTVECLTVVVADCLLQRELLLDSDRLYSAAAFLLLDETVGLMRRVW